MKLETAVGIEYGVISIACDIYVGANLFAYKRFIMRINSHLQQTTATAVSRMKHLLDFLIVAEQTVMGKHFIREELLR
jgi:hypothetical protein